MSELREATLIGLAHPETIDGGVWLRVDHPVLDPLVDGLPTVGWEGDERLVVYLHGESETFVLWRLEADGQYRPVAQIAGVLNEENTGKLCARLVEIDTHRGFDAGAEVIDAQDALEAEKVAQRNEWVSDFADKLYFGLAQSHLPGVDISRRTFTGFGG